MSPFHDLGSGRGSRGPARIAPSLTFAGAEQAAGGPPDASVELRHLSLPRFARVLSLAALGLAGLLSLGVGGVHLVQDHVARSSNLEVRDVTGTVRRAEASFSRANARRVSGDTRTAVAAKPVPLKSPEPALLEARGARGRTP